MTSFSEILENAVPTAGAFSTEVPEDWMQGRGAFGGLQGALAVRAMGQLASHQPLRALQCNFIAPLAGEVRVQARVLRTGKNTTQLEADLVGKDGLATKCMAVYGAGLESVVRIAPPPPPRFTTEPLVFPYIAGLTPAFIQHFQLQLLHGSPPFFGKAITETAFTIDFLGEGPATIEHMVALADVVPPVALSSLSKPTSGSTLSWMLEILAVPTYEVPLRPWRLDTELVAASDGYTNQSSTLWSPEGQAMALSRQSMLVFG